jgi:hypothetical protein
LDLVEGCRALEARLLKVTAARRLLMAGPQGDLQLQRLLAQVNELLQRYQSVRYVEVPFLAQAD